MSLIGMGLTVLSGGLGIGGVALRLLARPLFDRIWGVVKPFATWLFAHPAWIVAAVFALLWVIQKGEAQHWKKSDTGHVALIAAVKAEVDRGVGQNTRADQAPIWIRKFVANVWLWKGVADRQRDAAIAEHQDADKARAAAHQGAQPTADEKERDRIRKQLENPARVDGADTDWGKL